LGPRSCAALLRWAARLHEIGLVIAHSSYHKHSEYILRHCDLQGFSQTDQKLLAALVRLHRGKFAASVLEDLPTDWRAPVQKLAVIFRLAVLLHRSRSPGLRPPLRISADKRALKIELTEPGWLAEHPLTQADLEREAEYLRALDLRLRIEA
jgi:exopolyphosphatase / guanosine-5'-triphosphate,3'-diphosphate pyrophosphatase